MDHPGDVRVTWVRRHRLPDDLPDDLAAEVVRPTLLDADERDRAAAYHRVEDRERYVLGATLLHRELARATGADPAAPVVDRTCGRCGRPHGAPRPLDAGWSASVTHAGDVVAVAVRYGGALGIDVEAPSSVDRATMELVLSPAELAWVERGTDPPARFRRLWTGKEAVVKALGTGARDLAAVGLDPTGGCRVVQLPPGAAGPVDLAVHRLDDSTEVAVAVLGQAVPIEVVEVTGSTAAGAWRSAVAPASAELR